MTCSWVYEWCAPMQRIATPNALAPEICISSIVLLQAIAHDNADLPVIVAC
jgi:hypothetical protein